MGLTDWQEEYKRKLTTAEEAIKVVKAGDYVAFGYGMEPLALGLALVNRGLELGGLKVLAPAPGRDFGWYDPGWENTFQIEIAHVLPMVQQAIAERRCDYLVGTLTWAHKPEARRVPDVLLTQLSTPDEHGNCSFGSSVWSKREEIRAAGVVLAELNKNFIRTYGDNFIHISELDYIVEHTPSGKIPGSTDMLGRKMAGPGEREKKIAENVASIVRDGDCIEIGVGGTAEWLVNLGAFNDRRELGWHSENTVPGVVGLVKQGIMTGMRKNIHIGKMVATACGGGSKEDLDFINMNPLFELYTSDYVLDPRTISANDNVLAINSCLQIDLTGQIAAESLGHRMISGAGGQLAFAIGASLSKGGRSITVLPSTAREGTLSRIVPSFAPSTIVTVPRTLTDIVITEFGIARLKGKTQRERAQELINIAHPNFRAELKKQADSMF